MIRNEDFRPLPDDWDDGIVRGRLDGVDGEVFVWTLPVGCLTYYAHAIPGEEAECQRHLRGAAWNAMELWRLQSSDPDHIAWRERMAALAEEQERE